MSGSTAPAQGVSEPPERGGAALRVAYLVNQYPLLSHSFVRREIRALEAQGAYVLRVAVRPSAGALANAADREELERTRALLGAGAGALLGAVLRTLLARPGAALRALRTALAGAVRARGGVLRHLAYLAEACLLREWTAAWGAAHLHAHFGTNPAMVALLCRELGGPPYSFTVHGPEEFDAPLALSLPAKIRGAAFVVGVSEYGRAALARLCGEADRAKLHVVRCGVDAALLGQPPAPLAAGARLLSVGRLAEQKGQWILVDAAARLAAEGHAFDVAIAGEGPLRGELEARIARLGLGERVRLLGALAEPEVAEQMRAARAVVLPSLAEGLPVVIMEAFALGRPVVSTRVAGIPELVEPGVSGWLVPAGHVEALAAALREVLAAPDRELEAMGRAGAARVARAHDVRQEARTLAALFASPTADGAGG